MKFYFVRDVASLIDAANNANRAVATGKVRATVHTYVHML